MNMFQVGDRVEYFVSDAAREYNNYPPNGSKLGTVVGFYQAKQYYSRVRNFNKRPGVYLEQGCPTVRWDRGGRLENTYYIQFVDDEVRQNRRQQIINTPYEDRDNLFSYYGWSEELPISPFWEWDKVYYTNQQGIQECKIIDINYAEHGDHTYICEFKAHGGQMWLREKDLVLIERGNVWKYYNDRENLTFDDFKDEIALHKALGFTREIRNPKNSLYCWSLQEILQAIQDGIVDGFYMSHILTMLSNGELPPSHTAIKFHDENLGRRVAAETLKGFAEMLDK